MELQSAVAVAFCLLLGLILLLSCGYGNMVASHLANAQLTPFSTDSYHPFQLSYTLNDEEYRLGGNATNGIDVKNFILTPNTSMEVRLESTHNDVGDIVLLLPKTMIDGITSVKATVSGETADTQIRQAFANSTHSALQVAVPPGTENVIINAAYVAPEFEFATLIAAVSFTGIVAFVMLFRSKKYA